VGTENQQLFVNQLAGVSRKTVLNILSTLSSMLATAANWEYASSEVDLSELVLPDRNAYVPAHFTRSQVESLLSLAGEPWRTFFIVLTLTGLRAGAALGLQWSDIDVDHRCIDVRRSAW
jgi:integrase